LQPNPPTISFFGRRAYLGNNTFTSLESIYSLSSCMSKAGHVQSFRRAHMVTKRGHCEPRSSADPRLPSFSTVLQSADPLFIACADRLTIAIGTADDAHRAYASVSTCTAQYRRCDWDSTFPRHTTNINMSSAIPTYTLAEGEYRPSNAICLADQAPGAPIANPNTAQRVGHGPVRGLMLLQDTHLLET
jgi:hypothetical protein